jgi:hypothetical protein
MEYKDKTFCGFYKECANGENCDRALTPEVEKNAKEWWGGDDAPICQFIDKPECFKEQK